MLNIEVLMGSSALVLDYKSETMKSIRGTIDLHNQPLRWHELRSMSIADKISLKKKLIGELTLLRSLIVNSDDVNSRKKCCSKKISNNICSIEQHNIPASRKRKSSEINEGLNHSNAISKVTHLHCDDSIAKSKPSYILKRYSQKKQRCSDSNGFVDHLDKLEERTSLKSMHVAKQKSRLTETNLKAQIQPQYIYEKGAKDELAKELMEEKSRTEAKGKDAESAAQKTEFELKMKIEKQREASRLALEKMEATIEIDDFNQNFREWKELGCQTISYYVLKQLRFRLKDDDSNDRKIPEILIPADDDLERGISIV